jgi:hypothetical protein
MFHVAQRAIPYDALSSNVYRPGEHQFVSTMGLLGGQYELADADAVKEFNSRLKKWFTERGFKERYDMPLRSIERLPTRGNAIRAGQWGGMPDDWDKPGVVLCLEFDSQNALYILVPDCYHRQAHVQMIGFRGDLRIGSDKMQDYEIRMDKLRDDFERAFPSGNYRQGLPDDMPK